MRAAGNFICSHANHAERWNFVESATAIGLQRNFERCDRQLVHAERAEERIASNFLHDFFFARDDSGLWPSKEFISAE